jgi:hypothetical protein
LNLKEKREAKLQSKLPAAINKSPIQHLNDAGRRNEKQCALDQLSRLGLSRSQGQHETATQFRGVGFQDENHTSSRSRLSQSRMLHDNGNALLPPKPEVLALKVARKLPKRHRSDAEKKMIMTWKVSRRGLVLLQAQPNQHCLGKESMIRRK